MAYEVRVISEIDNKNIKLGKTFKYSLGNDSNYNLTNIKLCVDVPKFKQVISNIISNAIKYNVDGGSVMVSLGYHNHKVQIEIKDTGIGMTPNEIKKLGTAFFRGKRKEAPGTGLGWATIINICDLFGWKFNIISNNTIWKTIIIITI